MKYFPILDELFASDSVIFLLIGLAVAVAIGTKMNETRKNLIALIACFVLYAVCEVVSNVHINFMAELILLFIGTVSLGGIVGFLIGWIVSKVRRNKE